MLSTAWIGNIEIQNKYEKYIKSKYDRYIKYYRDKGEEVPEGYERFLFQCAAIEILLENKKAVLPHLKRLNELLLDRANECNLVINKEEIEAGTFKHKKVLRSTLERELGKLKFSKDFAKATDYLEPKLFRSLLSKGIIIKDPSLGITKEEEFNHGEFTHAIQWLIIALEQKKTNFLESPAVDVFKQMGDDRSILSVIRNGEESEEYNLWDKVVDEAPGHETCKSPEYLHNLILTSEDPDLSFLKLLCDSRVKKRNHYSRNPSIFHALYSRFWTVHKDYDNSLADKNVLLPISKQNKPCKNEPLHIYFMSVK